jgi:hypothetical protein
MPTVEDGCAILEPANMTTTIVLEWTTSWHSPKW